MWPEPAGEFGALELGELLWEELPPDWVKSGVGRKAAVGERGERLWVGEPGRLSPDDREWLREEKLRLVCRRGEGCMAKRLKRERRLSGVFSFLGFLAHLTILLL